MEEDCGASNFVSRILTKEFWSDYWEKKPLHARAEENEGPLVSLAIGPDDVFEFVLRHAENVSAYKEGARYPSSNVLLAYLDGASLIVNKVDRCCPKLLAFCQHLASQFLHHVFAVLYLTPPNTFGVRVHTDDQDTFLYQVVGRKHWKVYQAPVRLPYTDEMIGKSEPYTKDLGPPILDFWLNEGDVLYMPRGFPHEATTGDECSLHVTITAPTSDYCWGVCAERLMRSIVRDKLVSDESASLMRSSLLKPDIESWWGSAEEAEGKAEVALREIAALVNPKTMRSNFDSHIKRVNECQELEARNAMTISVIREVSMGSVVCLGADIECSLEEDSEIAIFHRGGQHLQLSISASARDLIRTLSDHRPLKVRDLPCVDMFERLFLCKVFLDKGIFRVFALTGEIKEGDEQKPNGGNPEPKTTTDETT